MAQEDLGGEEGAYCSDMVMIVVYCSDPMFNLINLLCTVQTLFYFTWLCTIENICFILFVLYG